MLWSLIHPRGDVTLSNLSGPIGIGLGFWRAAQSEYPVRFAIWFAVLLNLNLAIFNLLPVPVLDGGEMVFATIGRLRRRALPADFIMTTRGVFIVLLFSMIFYVSFFDVKRIVRDARDVQAESHEQAAPDQKAGVVPGTP
jgi:regulator of sigma E protease